MSWPAIPQAPRVSWPAIPEPEWVWNLPGGRELEFDDAQFKIKLRTNRPWSMPMNFGLLYGLDEPVRLTVWQRLLLGRHPG